MLLEEDKAAAEEKVNQEEIENIALQASWLTHNSLRR